MLPLNREGYTKQEVLDVLHGKHGASLFDFRFDLLNENEQVIGDVTPLIEAGQSQVDMDSEAEIHRTAKFRVRDTGQIDYLKHRIQPFARVKMPRKTERIQKTYGKTETTESDFSTGKLESLEATSEGDLELPQDKYMSFDGQDDTISGIGTAGMNWSQNTWEFWVRSKTDFANLPSSYYESFFGVEQYSPSFRMRVYARGSAGFIFNFLTSGGGTVQFPSSMLTVNEWVHVAIVRDGQAGEGMAYVNGDLVNIDSIGVPENNLTSDITIGQVMGYDPLHADLRDFRVWNYARTPEEINRDKGADLTGSESGLVLYYPMNPGDSTTLTDQSGNNNDGTVNGATPKTNYSLSFDGNDDYVDIPNSSSTLSMAGSTGFTMSAWKHFDGSDVNDAHYLDNIISKAHQWYNGMNGDYVFGGGLHSDKGDKFLTYITLGIQDESGNAWMNSFGYYLQKEDLPNWFKYTVKYKKTADSHIVDTYVHDYQGNQVNHAQNTRALADFGDIVSSSYNVNLMRSPRTLSAGIGKLKDATIWSKALSEQEIIDYLFENPDPANADVLACWPLVEGTGTIAQDIKGNHDGVINGATWENVYLKGGNRQSLPFDVSNTANISNTEIAWSATEPSGTSVTIETSLDGSTWSEASNGGAIPNVGDELTTNYLYVRQTLNTTDSSVTPQLHNLTITIDGWSKKVIQSQYIEFPLGVFLLSTPQKEYENNQQYRNIDAYDKLQILVDDGFTARYVAHEGDNIIDEVKQIIQDAGITKINIESHDKILPTWLAWDPDVSRLEVVNELLGIINYEPVYVDEYGYFTSRPYRTPAQRASEYEYKTDELSVIEPGATLNEDYFNVPNEWVGVVSEPDRVPLTYTYQNNNEDSPTSIPSRGRTITKYVDVDAADLDSLQGIVEKQAYKDSQVYTEMEFNTAIMPMHSYNDVYHIEHDELGANAKFEEISWSMPLDPQGSMSHRAKRVISLTGGA